MKNFCLGLALLTSLTLQAANNTPWFMVGPLTRIMLGNIESDSASFILHMPGQTSGICGVILSSSSNHEDMHDFTLLLNRFEISTKVPSKKATISRSFSRFPLTSENDEKLYINILNIKTKDGKSIAENVKRFYGYSFPVGVTADFCKRQS